MFRLLKADKDAYITDRVVNNVRKESANTGAASSLDLFKLYGITSSGSNPNVELSRLLIHFDLDPVRELVQQNKIDMTSPTFKCKLRLFDVNGGQTVPSNYTLTVHPLSRSFDEGLGRDVVLYDDFDVSNFLTGSRSQGPWILSGANEGGHVTGSVDYITTAVFDGVTGSVEVTQTFTKGDEDLSVDVTQIVSATLGGILPDEGFRIAFTPTLETDTRSYFVKRFAARKAFDDSFHPRLEVRYDDSVQDDTLNLEFDNDLNIFLYNFNQGAPANLVSSSLQVTGADSIVLKLETAVSAGFYTLEFSGSQHTLSGDEAIPVVGVYSASVNVSSSDPILAAKLAISGAIDFVPIWGSADGTVSYLTGSKVTMRPSLRGSSAQVPFSMDVTAYHLQAAHDDTEIVPVRINIFDRNSPRIVFVKTPIEFPGLVIRDVHYQVRCVDTGEKVIPFDSTYNSTRVSSDSDGMFFSLNMSSLIPNRRYVIDVLVIKNGGNHVFKDVSPVFRVVRNM